VEALNVSHVPIRIPQMGEGLVEARIVAFLKRAGDAVKRDEPLLEVETDKAILVIESPVDGVVEQWEVEEDDLLPIGAVIGAILGQTSPAPVTPAPTVAGGGTKYPARAPRRAVATDAHETYRAQPLPSSLPSPGPGMTHIKGNGAPPATVDREDKAAAELEDCNRNRVFSPRVRGYCSDQGISLEEMLTIPRPNPEEPLRIADVERWLHGRTSEAYQDRPLTSRHKMIATRLARSWQEAVPVSIEVECSWDAVEEARSLLGQRPDGALRPSSLTLIAWCVVQAMKNHARFRSALIGEHTLREYRQVHLGIAVGLPDDELTTAVLPRADTYAFESFAEALPASIERARGGHDLRGPMQLIISKLSRQNIRYATPMVVPPAVASLFIGAAYDVPRRNADDSVRWQKVAQLVLVFDHRIVNGIGAAAFLEEVQTNVAALPHVLRSVRDVPAQNPGES